jgi:hypothetical protein
MARPRSADADAPAAEDAEEAAVSMDERIENAKGVDKPEEHGVASVQSVTVELPDESPGSKEVGPSAPDTNPEAPPLHTGKPDEPIAQVLAAGSGQHTPPDPEVFGPDGRPIEKGSSDV